MPYAPGVSYQGDLHLSSGLKRLGNGLAQGMMGRQEESKLNQSAVKTLGFLKKQAENDPTIAELMGNVDLDNLSPRDARAMVDGFGRATQISSQFQQMDYQKLMGQNLENQMNAPPWQPSPIDFNGDGTPEMLMTSPSSAVPVPRPDSGGFSPYQQYQMERNLQQDRNRQLGGTGTLPGDNVDQYIARTYDSAGKLVGKKDPMFEQHIDYLNEQARALGRPPVFERPRPVEELMGGPGAVLSAQTQAAVVDEKPPVPVAVETPPEVAAAMKWLNDNPDNPAAAGVRARLVREGYLKE